ncbi:MAG: hypothetical protein H6584_05705 [Flavobacteriales bacterium]|nr:hypothetical protein [Flavobacteriales bacterium]
MPIKSYLAYPFDSKKEALKQEILALQNCEVIPAENKDVLIVVTDTENTTQEDQLKAKLETLDNLKLLTMVSGFNTNKKE